MNDEQNKPNSSTGAAGENAAADLAAIVQPFEAPAFEGQAESLLPDVAPPAAGPIATESQGEPVVTESVAAEPDMDESFVNEAVAAESETVELPAAPAIEPAVGDEPVAVGNETPTGNETPEPPSEGKKWYILKVQSNREDTIREALQKRVKIEGLDRFFGDVIVPIEMVTEFKGGKKRVVKRKLYPGYLVVNMELNDDTWYLVRDTPGIGDFTGASGHPAPMLPHEVARIVARHEEKSEEAPKLKISFHTGDRVKINEGTFENFEGEVDAIDQTNGRVTVMINIFGRSTPVELEYWQIETM